MKLHYILHAHSECEPLLKSYRMECSCWRLGSKMLRVAWAVLSAVVAHSEHIVNELFACLFVGKLLSHHRSHIWTVALHCYLHMLSSFLSCWLAFVLCLICFDVCRVWVLYVCRVWVRRSHNIREAEPCPRKEVACMIRQLFGR